MASKGWGIGNLDVPRLLELIAVLVLSLSAIGLLLARLGIFHAPQVWLGALAVTCLYGRFVYPAGVAESDTAPFWHLAVVIGVGLFFRLTPYSYFMGGQDEGVYVNMAMELVRTGGLHPIDPVLQRITDPAVLDVYRQSYYAPTAYLPGVYTTDHGLEFQFYHLFPVWLALFGDIFGPQGAAYGLTMLSLVSLLFFQRLAHLIGGKARVGLYAGLLLAVNPLHAFFSKFPVTEVPTLAFSAMSFVFLVSYWKTVEEEGRWRYLIISLAALAMLFMTRISGFMYMPIILAIYVIAMLFEHDPAKRRGLMCWALAAALTYALSVAYGLKWSATYSNDIYRLSFGSLLGEQWSKSLYWLVMATVLTWAAVWWLSKRPAWHAFMRRGVQFGASALPFLALGLALMAAYRAYRLGYTDAYATHPWLGQRFGLSHQGLRSVFSTSLFASISYLSPFVVLAFFVASFRVAAYSLLRVLLFFVVCFLGHIAVLQWNLPYQPYYARYLLSEFVPYLILFVVCAWAVMEPGRLRKAVGIALVLSGVYSASLSVMQIGKNEHRGVLESLDQIVSRFDTGDLVVVDAGLKVPLAHELKTPLVFTYGLNVATMTRSDIVNERYLRGLSKPYDDVYFITREAAPPAGFVSVDSIRFVEPVFAHGVTPPIRVVPRSNARLFIHKYVGDAQAVAARVQFGAGSPGVDLLHAGWSTPEAWGVWTTADRAYLRSDGLGRNTLRKPVLKITGRAYVTPKSPVQRIRITINDIEVAAVSAKHPQQTVEIVVPLPETVHADGAMEIIFHTPDAVSPQRLGYAPDGRNIAFGLESIELIDAAM